MKNHGSHFVDNPAAPPSRLIVKRNSDAARANHVCRMLRKVHKIPGAPNIRLRRAHTDGNGLRTPISVRSLRVLLPEKMLFA